jgi:hypothetical protein
MYVSCNYSHLNQCQDSSKHKEFAKDVYKFGCVLSYIYIGIIYSIRRAVGCAVMTTGP